MRNLKKRLEELKTLLSDEVIIKLDEGIVVYPIAYMSDIRDRLKRLIRELPDDEDTIEYLRDTAMTTVEKMRDDEVVDVSISNNGKKISIHRVKGYVPTMSTEEEKYE